jgi:hypothetical protein
MLERLHAPSCMVAEEHGSVGSRPWLGSLLLAYYDPRGAVGLRRPRWYRIDHAELERLWRRLRLLAVPDMPLDIPPPRASRFGAPLVLSRVLRLA